MRRVKKEHREQVTNHNALDDIRTPKAVGNLHLVLLSGPDVLDADYAGELLAGGQRHTVHDSDGEGGLQRRQTGDSAEHNCVGSRSMRTRVLDGKSLDGERRAQCGGHRGKGATDACTVVWGADDRCTCDAGRINVNARGERRRWRGEGHRLARQQRQRAGVGGERHGRESSLRVP